MDIALDEVLHFDAITSHPSTGAATDADSTPTWEVFEEDTDTAIGSGSFTKRTSKTGNYRGTHTLSAANGYEVGKWYTVVASATVNSVAGKGIIQRFRIVVAESAAGVPKTDTTHFGGTAGTFATGIPEVKVASMATNSLTAAAIAADAGAELAALVETYIVNEGDATAVLQAVADKIAADWVAGDASPLAIASAVWSAASRTITGGSLTTSPPTAAAIADAVWDEARTGHTTSGTFGFYLDAAISGISGGGGGSGDAEQATLLEVQDTVDSIAVALAGSAPVEPTGVSMREQLTEIHEAVFPLDPDDSPLVITPSEVGKVTGYAVCYGLDGEAAAGIVVTYKLQSPPPRDAGRILNGSTTGTRTSASNGLITFPGLFPGSTYYFTCGLNQVSITIPLDADSETGYELPSFKKT